MTTRMRRTLPLALMGLVTAPLAALPDGGPPAKGGYDPPADWRKNPALYARRVQDARAFLALPPDRQERMRRLDERLHAETDSSTRARLLDVMKRYADWLDRLPEGERRRVTDAPAKHARLPPI